MSPGLQELRAKRRFRAVVRLVIANRWWLDDFGSSTDLGDNVLINVHLLTRKREKLTSVLKVEEKALLNKPSNERSDEDRIKILEIINRLKCFEKYPMDVKEKLTGVLTFCFYGSGRTLLRENHPPFALYYLISGEVNVTQESYDPLLNTTTVVDLGVMGPGSVLGEIALLLKINRTATVTTNTACEFLKIDREYLDIIWDTVWMNWEQLLHTLNKFSYFRSLDEISSRECCVLSKIKSFEPDEIVFGDDQEQSLLNYVYFIVDGYCYVMEHLLLRVKHGPGKKKMYALHETERKEEQTEKRRFRSTVDSLFENRRTKTNRSVTQPQFDKSDPTVKIETHYVRVCEIGPMGCFNIGEAFHHRNVIAKTKVQCLLIPRFWLVQKQKDNVWNYIKHFLDSHIPTTKQIFDDFLKQKKWEAYKQRLVADIVVGKKVITGNSYHNVPYTLRIGKDLDLL